MMPRPQRFDSSFFPVLTALFRLTFFGAVSCAIAGCQNTGRTQTFSFARVFSPEAPLKVTTAPAETPRPSSVVGTRSPAVVALHLSFDVLRARVHRGSFSESGKIWNHLDEQVVPADRAAGLQRNGLRIARGKITSWPPIKALLDSEKDIDATQNAMTVGNGLPLTIELDAQPHDQTLFLFRQDGTLGGVTLPASMNLLRIEYAIPITSPESVLVNVMPEIRQQSPEPAITPGGWMERPMAPPSRVFRELAVQVQVGPDEFLAIGPAPAAHRVHTMGSLLLGQEIEGRRYECMFFLTPRVIRKELPSGANAGADRSAAALLGQ